VGTIKELIRIFLKRNLNELTLMLSTQQVEKTLCKAKILFSV